MDQLDRLLPPAVVADRLGLSRTTLWRMVRDGHFPAPGKISPGRSAWAEAVVTAWFAERFGTVAGPAKAEASYPSHHH